MADDLADSGKWRDRVETRLGKLEASVEEQARLRAAMDEDLRKLHVERKMLQAIQDTQSDHTRRLTTLESKVDTLESKVDLVHIGVEAIRELLERDPGNPD
jgi:chromosome segregation ATPase